MPHRRNSLRDWAFAQTQLGGRPSQTRPFFKFKKSGGAGVSPERGAGRQPRSHSKFRTIGLLVTLCMLLVTPATAAERQVRLNYGLSHFIVSTAAVFAVPKQAGFWKAEGLDVTLEGANGGSVALQQLATRQVQATITGVPSLMQVREKGAPVIAVASVYSGNPFFPVVLASSPLKSIAAFKGKSVAVMSLSVSHVYWLRAILKKEGVDPKDVTLVPVGSGVPAIHALRTGRVDAFEAFDGAYAEMEVQGAEFRKFDNLPYLKDLSFVQGFYVREDAVQAEPEMIVGLIRGVIKGIIFARENPQAAVRLHWKEFPTSKPVGVDDATAMKNALYVLAAQMKTLDPANFGRVTLDQVAASRDVLFDNGAIEKKLEAAAYYTDRFLDRANAFDREAVKNAAREIKVQ